MATKVFLTSPGVAIENVVEGVGAAVQSSFVVGLTINMAATINDNGTTRPILKSEVIQAMRNLEGVILKDANSDWG